MPTADYSSFHQPSGTGADGTKLDNFIDAVQATVNGLDNNNIANGAGIALSKLSGAYSAYVPTWTSSSGSAPAIGNASVTALWVQIGKLVHAYGRITFGSTSTFGTTGSWGFALPTNASGNFNNAQDVLGSVYLLHVASSATMAAQASNINLGAGVMGVRFPLTYGGTDTALGLSVPWTWAVGDVISWNITYEAA